MIRIFVSGPLGAPGAWDRNLTVACAVADRLIALGAVPFVPHTSIAWARVTGAGAERSWDAWLQWCEAWIDVCDAVLRIPGVSPGADREVAYAKHAGVPVFFDEFEISRWVRDQ